MMIRTLALAALVSFSGVAHADILSEMPTQVWMQCGPATMPVLVEMSAHAQDIFKCEEQTVGSVVSQEKNFKITVGAQTYEATLDSSFLSRHSVDSCSKRSEIAVSLSNQFSEWTLMMGATKWTITSADNSGTVCSGKVPSPVIPGTPPATAK